MSRTFSLPGEDTPVIDRNAVLEFFEKRAEKVKTLGPTRAVIYQDKSPDLAERRDKTEKGLLFPFLQLDKDSRVLDAGCGTGRWAEMIIPACGTYHGVDVSPGLIQVAQELYGHFPNVRFSVCSLDKLSPDTIGAVRLFDRILSVGVYIYLNDHEVLEALRRLVRLAAPITRLIMREPIAVQNRLTLREHFSEDMDQNYNAIYRTESELLAMLEATIGVAGFRMTESGDVYAESALNNRVETKQRWFLWERR
jgi:cyclopropane fatty-acyl-phospholipid synthase-like methyltransferase